MRIVALCKTHSGNEFIEAAIESLYDFVDYFVFVNSDTNWIGKEIPNVVKPAIEKWQNKNDVKNKIIHIDANVDNQWKQCDIGYRYIRDNLRADWVQSFDSDEIWDQPGLFQARRVLDNAVHYNAVSANMYTYIKSPFYRVFPTELCKPTVFFRPMHYHMWGTRGNNVVPRLFDPGLIFHHFTYVRSNEQDVFDKIETTLDGDKDDNPTCQLVDMKKWRTEKWDKLPRCKNFHTTKMFEKSWYSIKKITIRDLPETLRDKPIVQQFVRRAI